jgi:hypothetical protein
MVTTKSSAFFAVLYLLQEGGANSSLVEVGVTTYKLFTFNTRKKAADAKYGLW